MRDAATRASTVEALVQARETLDRFRRAVRDSVEARPPTPIAWTVRQWAGVHDALLYAEAALLYLERDARGEVSPEEEVLAERLTADLLRIAAGWPPDLEAHGDVEKAE